ncbi:MAG TPA: hypothetical protein VF221_23345 [Chloroflexota bacterium]
MTTPGTLCLVTIHGIGFQQPPVGDTAGYADVLHERLAEYLDASILSDDPQRSRTRRGEAGPIYVQSSWPPDSLNTEGGLQRLGTWEMSRLRAVDGSHAPLVAHGARVAHIALVYSHLQDQEPRLGSALETAVRAAASLGHYTTVSGLIRTVFGDTAALLEKRSLQTDSAAGTSLQTRTDAPRTTPHLLRHLLPHHAAASTGAPTGLLATLRTLEDDVAAYVCRNDLRERVRAFVRDAVHRLCYRDDVAGVVVNAHSNGTVIGFDVLRQLTPVAAQKVRWVVTAGSPLRKYTELFYWGTDVGSMRDMGAPKRWTNFWDEKDPVADPLAPPVEWLRGMSLPPSSDQASLYQEISETGVVSPRPVDDELVDNLKNSTGGGLQAHNYWDNQEQVVRPLAEIVRQSLSASS